MAWIEVYGGQGSLAFELTTAMLGLFQTSCYCRAKLARL